MKRDFPFDNQVALSLPAFQQGIKSTNEPTGIFHSPPHWPRTLTARCSTWVTRGVGSWDGVSEPRARGEQFFWLRFTLSGVLILPPIQGHILLNASRRCSAFTYFVIHSFIPQMLTGCDVFLECLVAPSSYPKRRWVLPSTLLARHLLFVPGRVPGA